MRTFKKSVACFVVAAFTWTGMLQAAQAGMVATEQVHAAQSAQQQRERIAAALNRPDVAAQLQERGVDMHEAQARIAALSDEEAAQLAGKIDSLPAGGDGIVGALVLIFFVLLVTDILGLTKVFPFTRSHR